LVTLSSIDGVELAAMEAGGDAGLELPDLRVVHHVVEHHDERVRVQLLQLERAQPEVGISVVLKPAFETGVELRVSDRDLAVFAEREKVVPEQ
jgi:hypothetical protein